MMLMSTGWYHDDNDCSSQKYVLFLFACVLFSLGDSLMHRACQGGNEDAALFLATHGASSSISNHKVGFQTDFIGIMILLCLWHLNYCILCNMIPEDSCSLTDICWQVWT